MKQLDLKRYISAEDYEQILRKFDGQDFNLTNIDEVFNEMETKKTEILHSETNLDHLRLLVRGAVTRIGAYSNIGKSKFAYWIVCQLLKNGYKGIIFSTEVSRHTVLANLVSHYDKIDTWSLMTNRAFASQMTKQALQNLQIYDGLVALHLANIRDFIIANNGKIDFVMVDFCQNIKDYKGSKTEYEQMTNYALEIQQLAQAMNICIIDLSQLSNDSVKTGSEGYKASGFIAYKGSGALYASADIGVQLIRDKINNPDTLQVDVRKHKFYRTGECNFTADFATVNFMYTNNPITSNKNTYANPFQK